MQGNEFVAMTMPKRLLAAAWALPMPLWPTTSKHSQIATYQPLVILYAQNIDAGFKYSCITM